MIIFSLMVVTILVAAVKGISTWRHNNAQPVLSVTVKVVGKRADVSHHTHTQANNGIDHSNFHSSTTYYVTFEVESGDRLEFKVSGREYGMIAEGDVGKLTFQGTRYLGFEREKRAELGR